MHTKSAIEVFILICHALVREEKQTIAVNWVYIGAYQQKYIEKLINNHTRVLLQR